MDYLAILREFGPTIALGIFVLYHDIKREARLSARIEKLEGEQKQTIVPLVEKTTEVIAHNTAIMQRLEAALNKP